jgi:putative flavoprotein involved in K+ transport
MSMIKAVNTVVVGAGQAGLSVSHYLTKLSVDHAVLEQADRAGDAWRNHRWDSFSLNTPRWQSRLPGVAYGADDPDGFMSRAEIVSHLEALARPLPIRYGTHVVAIEPQCECGGYVVALDDGETIEARNVVMATGLYQTPRLPALGGSFPADIKQLHSDLYRNPQQLLPGAVLVVGSAQSGAQIAEELYESGRKVYLAVGRAGRTPRRYRGKDANWWLARMGAYDRKVSELPSPKAKFSGKPHISGTKGGHTINLHQFARDGVVLVGRLLGVRDGIVHLAGDLHDNLAAADRAEAEFVKSVDDYIARAGMTVPQESLPTLRDGFAQPVLTELDLKACGVTNVIWATGYSFDFSVIKLPVFDNDGFPIQTRGVTAYEGLFFVGLPWLHTAKSGLIYGVGEDARHIAERVAARQGVESLPTADRWRRLGGKILTLARVAVSVAAFALTLPSSHASVDIPEPPHIRLLATPVSKLHLGMSEQDVVRVVGKPAKQTSFIADGVETLTLTFSEPIPGRVTLSNGKVSRIMLDPFRAEKDILPSFVRQAWPGLAASAVRHVVGNPDSVRHHSFFGIDVDQWLFSRAGSADVSIFLRADRVIAKATGEDVPADLFRVDLPSLPEPKSRRPKLTARVGMTTNELAQFDGPVEFRVDYIVNGQPGSRVVLAACGQRPSIEIGFIDGIVTELEDLGRLSGETAFRGH